MPKTAASDYKDLELDAFLCLVRCLPINLPAPFFFVFLLRTLEQRISLFLGATAASFLLFSFLSPFP